MNELIKQFGKKKEVKRSKGNNAIIYTRVSSKEQSTNNSLEVQIEECTKYAVAHNLNIVATFGGTYESAKNDDNRKEFSKLLEYVKKNKNTIAYVIVYRYNRFSRSGSKAISIVDKLLDDYGVQVISTTAKIETNTEKGKLQIDKELIAAKEDNLTRMEATLPGLEKKLRRGEWLGRPPRGYEIIYKYSKNQIIQFTEEAKFIKEAFVLKSQGISNMDIVRKLNSTGFKISKQQLTDILKNPFYMGYISHKMLNGEVIKGKHEPLITEDMFLSVNNITAKHHQGYEQVKSNEKYPLKHFIKCDRCGTYFVGYLVKKKEIDYYKCNKIGCKCNVNANRLHEQFKLQLSEYSINQEFIDDFKTQLISTFGSENKRSRDLSIQLNKQLTEINKKLDSLEERFAIGEINKELFEKFTKKYSDEKLPILQELQITEKELSNLEKYVSFALQMAANLPILWGKANHTEKLQLQNLLFPNGIFYSKEKNGYRTEKVNLIFSKIAAKSREAEDNKKGQIGENTDLSLTVAGTGLEPMSA
jgi:DNA invertase Pin-like site-specific DNA recombinase